MTVKWWKIKIKHVGTPSFLFRVRQLRHSNASSDGPQRSGATVGLPPTYAISERIPLLQPDQSGSCDHCYYQACVDTLGISSRCNLGFQVDMLGPSRAGKAADVLFTASQELQAEFNSLLSSPSTFGLIVGIEKESLVPLTTLPSQGPSFLENLGSLQSHLEPNVPLYILLRRYDDMPRLTAISYVPDTAHVRQKMLFASTRLTLVRELGSEHFRETIFVTTADELSESGFKKHDAHTELAAPLTEEERTLGEVKRAEQEAGSGTGTREIHLSKSFAMPVAEDAVAALKDLGQDDGRVVAMLVSAKANGESSGKAG